MRHVDGITHVNCGDWVDSCTAIVEHLDGELELIRAWQPAAAPRPMEFEPNGVAPAPTVLNPSPFELGPRDREIRL